MTKKICFFLLLCFLAIGVSIGFSASAAENVIIDEGQARIEEGVVIVDETQPLPRQDAPQDEAVPINMNENAEGNLLVLDATETGDETQANDGESAREDETVSAKDLDSSGPILTPNSRFYFLKDWWRAIKISLSFKSLSKAEVRLQNANERLLEAQKMAEEEGDAEQAEKIAGIIEKYAAELAKVKEEIDKMKQEVGVTEEEVGKFTGKFIAFKLKHQRILDKLEGKLPAEVFERIEQNREKAITRFGEVMAKIQTKEQFKERLKNALEKEKGSELKEFKQAYILRRLGENLPEDLKTAIRQERTEILKKLNKQIENISDDLRKEKMNNYLQNISGEETKKLEVMKEINSSGLPAKIRQEINEVKNAQIERAKRKK